MGTYPLTNVRTVEQSNGYVWDTNTLAFVPMTQPGGATGGAGDASAANQTTEIARLTSLLTELGLKADLTETQPVSLATVPSHAVTNAGTFAVQVTSAPTTAVTLASVPSHAVTNAGTFAVQVGKVALTASSPTAAQVGTASGQVLAATARKGLTLVNTSTNDISLGFGVAAVLNSGITLKANGGAFVMDEYTFSAQAVNAIAGGAASNLAIQEFV